MLKPTIFIVDDEPSIGKIAAFILHPSDYTIVNVSNGADAYDQIMENPPQLVFSDIRMPNGDGIELCQKIKQNPRTASIPFIFLTAVEKADLDDVDMTYHADDVLVKPFSSEDMMAKIRQWVLPCDTDSPDPQVTSTQLGVSTIDHPLFHTISPETFILVSGPIGSGKSNLTRQFLLDGIRRQQPCVLLSFEGTKHAKDPLQQLSPQVQSLLHVCDASRWTQLQSSPWRNLDFIYDHLSDICSHTLIYRVVIDSFSHGIPFWSIKDMLKFIDLCRGLPNAANQCVMWTMNSHPSIESLEYHLQHVMDIGIHMQRDQHDYTGHIHYSKWQSYDHPIIHMTGASTLH